MPGRVMAGLDPAIHAQLFSSAYAVGPRLNARISSAHDGIALL